MIGASLSAGARGETGLSNGEAQWAWEDHYLAIGREMSCMVLHRTTVNYLTTENHAICVGKHGCFLAYVKILRESNR